MLSALRSALFIAWMAVTVVPWALAVLVASLFLRGDRIYWMCAGWLRTAMWGCRVICGVRSRIHGMDNLPPADRHSPVILLSKHQSTWETFTYPAIMSHPLAYVFKRELLYIPFFGWAMGRMDMIHIDRSKRNEAFTRVVEQGKRILANGSWIIMFPEGTRIAARPAGHLQDRRHAAGAGHRRAGGADRRGFGALLAAQEPARAAGRGRHLDRQADCGGRPRGRRADARGGSLDRGRDAAPRPRGLRRRAGAGQPRFGAGQLKMISSSKTDAATATTTLTASSSQ